jgi:hypothetical protein
VTVIERRRCVMNKRSAMAIAAGMVVALMVGAAAVSIGLGGPGTAAAGTARAAGNPVVRTSHRTVTIHKPAKDSPAPRTVVIGSTWTSASSSAISQEDDGFEGPDGTDGDSGGGSEGGGSGSGGGDD